ncbi:hypothetical protein HLK59_27495 [Streptomyces sp. S3(2020)]|uniref:hypothetical protein n=1 Tax=Streptomyces sp. S3(2020) TaxID=2732044 RepID=UPI00148874EB|nr:hypothetical protein [Streptomyces sp. S3(2020)]NNN34041.1 hypothetical protein [Streptomyces sp. S3(2020)]
MSAAPTKDTRAPAAATRTARAPEIRPLNRAAAPGIEYPLVTNPALEPLAAAPG